MTTIISIVMSIIIIIIIILICTVLVYDSIIKQDIYQTINNLEIQIKKCDIVPDNYPCNKMIEQSTIDYMTDAYAIINKAILILVTLVILILLIFIIYIIYNLYNKFKPNLRNITRPRITRTPPNTPRISPIVRNVPITVHRSL